MTVLFHYHFWTPHLEEMENFYKSQGFRVHQRIGKYEGEFQTFNPPLTWEDIRDKGVLFRIIEMKKENVNVTFGFGKRVIFDHIGFIVTNDEKRRICKNANSLAWKVDRGERRTFISTPYKFLIELQTHQDAIDGDGKEKNIKKMVIATPSIGLEKDLSVLFGKEMTEIQSIIDEQVMLKEVKFSNTIKQTTTDPNGLMLVVEKG